MGNPPYEQPSSMHVLCVHAESMQCIESTIPSASVLIGAQCGNSVHITTVYIDVRALSSLDHSLASMQQITCLYYHPNVKECLPGVAPRF